ncbi:MAG: aldose 1-epimerase family protein [Clostridia bacterium]|nr:aldose 1-epimerase family protein [Clostridia bacterium]
MMEKLYSIENGHMRVEISDLGAEMREILLKRRGESLLWTGDPAVWRGHAPWLFPVIGRLKDDYFTFRGRRFDMPMHGFARKALFTAVETGEDAVCFELSDSPETLAVYPWRFALRVAYRLRGEELEIACRLRNRDDKPMFFSLGAHPGFLCSEGDKLFFDGVNELTCHRLTADTHLLRPGSVAVLLDGHALTLSGALFEADAMLLKSPDIAGVTLRRAVRPSVRLTFDRVPWLGVWSKPVDGGLRYVCLEPWLGVDDPVDSDHEIEHKEAIQRLEAGGETAFNLTVQTV